MEVVWRRYANQFAAGSRKRVGGGAGCRPLCQDRVLRDGCRQGRAHVWRCRAANLAVHRVETPTQCKIRRKCKAHKPRRQPRRQVQVNQQVRQVHVFRYCARLDQVQGPVQVINKQPARTIWHLPHHVDARKRGQRGTQRDPFEVLKRDIKPLVWGRRDLRRKDKTDRDNRTET